MLEYIPLALLLWKKHVMTHDKKKTRQNSPNIVVEVITFGAFPL